MKIKSKISDIFLKKLDTIINPRIENKVIYGTFISGCTIIFGSKLLIPFLAAISFESETIQFILEVNNKIDTEAMILGSILISGAGILLYL